MKKRMLPIALFVLQAATSLKGNAQATLDVNEIRTQVLPGNSLFWDQNSLPSYEVPKGSGKHSLFLGNLWVLGKKAGTQTLHGIGDRYHANGSDTWPGPLKTDGSAGTAAAVVTNFTRVWTLNRVEVDALIQAQNNGTLVSGTYNPPPDIAQWPANGPAGYAGQLAPFHDQNGDGIYNILNGDYPIMKGQQMLYWIINDNYGNHLETEANPLGAEIHVSLYAYSDPAALGNAAVLNYTTFLEYEIFNRSANNYDSVYAGFNTDCDIGYAFDDYTGCHVDADAFYFYNGDNFDGSTNPGPSNYGENWPVQSIQFLEGKTIDDHTLRSYRYYTNGTGLWGGPQIGYPQQYYNNINGSEVLYGGDGSTSTLLTSYMFSGPSDPDHYGTGGIDPGFDWSQAVPCPSCLSVPPGDQRGVGATGPFTLNAGGSIKVVLGLISTFDSTLSPLDRVEKNRNQNKYLRSLYKSGELSVSSEDGVQEIFNVYPNPAESYTLITGQGLVAGSTYRLLDLNGKAIREGVSVQNGSLYLPTDDLPAGFYFVHLKTPSGKQAAVKVLKR